MTGEMSKADVTRESDLDNIALAHAAYMASPERATEDNEAPRNFDGERIVTIQVAAAYVHQYPHLRHLQANLSRSRQAHIAFAQNALRLALPPHVSLLDAWHLAALAEGEV